VLRSSGLEILGSGPGTIPLAEIIGAIPQFMAIAADGGLPIEIDEIPPRRGRGGLAWPRWRRAAGRPPALSRQDQAARQAVAPGPS
jgi:hypothetical protein